MMRFSAFLAFLVSLITHIIFGYLFFFYKGDVLASVEPEQKEEAQIEILKMRTSMLAQPEKKQVAPVESKELEDSPAESIEEETPTLEESTEVDYSQSSSLKGYELIKLHGRSKYSMLTSPPKKKQQKKMAKSPQEESMQDYINEMAQACYPESLREKGVRRTAIIAIIEGFGTMHSNARLIDSTGFMELDYCALSVGELIMQDEHEMQKLRTAGKNRGEYRFKLIFEPNMMK